MNKNTIIGLVIIVAILIAFSYINRPSKEEREKQQRLKDSVAKVEKEKKKSDSILLAEENAKKILQDSIIKDSVKTIAKNDTSKKADSVVAVPVVNKEYGAFASSLSNEKKQISIETAKLKLMFNTLGGNFSYIELKDFYTYDKKPLILFNSDSSLYNYSFSDTLNNYINTRALVFEPTVLTDKFKNDTNIVISGTDSVKLAMRLYPDTTVNPDRKKYIEFIYTVYGDEYMIGSKLRVENIEMREKNLVLGWKMDPQQKEKNLDNERTQTEIYYKCFDSKVQDESDTDNEPKAIRGKISWVGYKQQFFTSVLIADEGISDNSNNEISITLPAESEKSSALLKHCYSEFNIQLDDHASKTVPMRMYFGPNNYKILRSYHLDLERQIPLGWSFFLLQWINRYAVIPVFNWLSGFGWNYGIIILILTVLLKIVLFPIAYKTYVSSAKMRVLKPEIEEINSKIPKEKAMERQQATMALYKKAGVNPLAGCVPMLLQMPILIAFFRFFPSSIELRQQGFLWADDLSSYDSILDLGFNIPFYGDHVSLFCLLMTVSTIIYTKVNNQLMGTQQQMPGMKFMMYAMPVMFLGFLNSFSAGLNYYYFLANMFTFLQMWIIRKTINEEAIHAKIQENRKRPDTKKKSGFQKRLELMAKQRGYKMPK